MSFVRCHADLRQLYTFPTRRSSDLLSDQSDLEKKTIEALGQYRKALATVERQEQTEATAQRALTRMLPDLERAILEDCSPSVKEDRKSTRLNSSHVSISYAVFCLKK